MNKKVRIGALISGSGTNLQAIIDGCERGTISGQVVFVGSDNPDAAGLERARNRFSPLPSPFTSMCGQRLPSDTLLGA